ncbi:MAG: hypothetical protein H6733_17690 [Alphaproteobacteria bacterium]|nr:hypothetical protein [Alphaproteobacteria bacterium]
MWGVVVQLPPWLAAQQVRGEPIPARWERIARAAGARLVVVGPGEEADGDVVVDGRALALGPDHLTEVATAGRALVVGTAEDDHGATDAALSDDRTVPRVDLGHLQAHGGTVVAVPRALAPRVGRVEAVPRARVLEAWRYAPVHDVAALRILEDDELARAVAEAEACGARFVGAPPFLGPSVLLEPGCTVWQGAILLGATTVARGAVVGAGCHLVDTTLQEGAVCHPYTVAEGAVVGAGCQVGPFARLRPGTVLGTGVRIGNFVETKNAVLAAGAKANHLSYLGDCSVGEAANVGAGTITCNYDGARKHHTAIGAGAFVGTHTSLVAPVAVGAGALVGAGSVITDDVPDGALALGRGRQVVFDDRGAAILAANQAAKDRERGG